MANFMQDKEELESLEEVLTKFYTKKEDPEIEKILSEAEVDEEILAQAKQSMHEASNEFTSVMEMQKTLTEVYKELTTEEDNV